MRLTQALHALALGIALVVLTHEGFIFFSNYCGVSSAISEPALPIIIIGNPLARVKLERIWRKKWQDIIRGHRHLRGGLAGPH